MSDDLSPDAPLLAVLDYLDPGRGHIATQFPGHIAELAAANPDRLAGMVLCAPMFLDPAQFIRLAVRVLMVSGEYGPTFDMTVRAVARLPGAERHVLDGYEAQTWSDVAAYRTAELILANLSHAFQGAKIRQSSGPEKEVAEQVVKRSVAPPTSVILRVGGFHENPRRSMAVFDAIVAQPTRGLPSPLRLPQRFDQRETSWYCSTLWRCQPLLAAPL
jgi:hypothetical protein